MDKIHDKANKLFNDVRGKKNLAGKNIRCDNADKAKPNLSLNSCFYCQKVFVNSQYLMKHIIRRHSDDLVSLHKKCVKHESNNNSDDFQYLMSFLEKEFLKLKNELFTVRQGVRDKNKSGEEFNVNHYTEEQEHITYVGESCGKTDVINATDVNLNELKTLKESISKVEKNLEKLNSKFVDFDKVLKNDVLLKDDMAKHIAYTDEKIRRTVEIQSEELRQTLLHDLETMFSKQLHENNRDWKSQLSEVRDDIVRLDNIVANINKQVNSPDSLKEIEKRLENQIVYFLGNKSHRNSKRNHLRHEARSVRASARDSKQLKHSTELSGTKTTSPYSKSKRKYVNEKTSIPAHEERFANHNTLDELSFLVAEKLSELCVDPDTSKLPLSELEEKLKLLNLEKERLASRYPNFSENYNSINVCANHKVHSKLKHKHHKIRFSDPLTTSRKSSESDRNPAAGSAGFENPTPEVSSLPNSHSEVLNKSRNQVISKSDSDKFPAAKEKSFLTIKNRRSPNTGADANSFFKFPSRPNTFVNQAQSGDTREFEPPSPVPRTVKSEIFPSSHNIDKPQEVIDSRLERERTRAALPSSESKQYSTSKKQRYPYTENRAGGDFQTKFSESPNDAQIHQMQSVSAEEFTTSSPVSKTNNLKKLRVTFVEECSVINSDHSVSSEMQNYASSEVKNVNTAKASDKTHFYMPKQKIDLTEDDKLKTVNDDSDVSELESLSSWEDDDDC